MRLAVVKIQSVFDFCDLGQCYVRPNRTKESYWLLRWKSRLQADNMTPEHIFFGCYLALRRLIWKEDSIDTGCVLHYKVNPCVNSPTDGLTCWAAGMRFRWGKKLKIIAACLVTANRREEWVSLGKNPTTGEEKKKREKKLKNVSCSDVIRKAKAEL